MLDMSIIYGMNTLDASGNLEFQLSVGKAEEIQESCELAGIVINHMLTSAWGGLHLVFDIGGYTQ